MKKLLIGLLALGSISVFASDCDKALGNLTAFAENHGGARAYIIKNEAAITLNNNILSMFETTPDSPYLNTCFSKDHLKQLVAEDTQAIKDLTDPDYENSLNFWKENVKSSCR